MIQTPSALEKIPHAKGLKKFHKTNFPHSFFLNFSSLPDWTFALLFALTMQNIIAVHSNIRHQKGNLSCSYSHFFEAVTSFFPNIHSSNFVQNKLSILHTCSARHVPVK